MVRNIFKYVILGVVILAVGSYIYDRFNDYKEKKEWEKYVAGLVDTASPNVQILIDTVHIDYLDEKRTLSVYLPPGYHHDSTRYPVIYFLDGQSPFNEKILEGDEWQVDEVLDSTIINGGPESIVIGVYNSENRRTEYKPFLSPHVPTEKSVTGDQHAEWVATDLKRWVDSRFRTIPDPHATTIGGASLGGLMSYYIICTYPEIYGNAIVFSPSFWVNDKVYDLHQNVPDFSNKRIYINAGSLETPTVENAKKVVDLLRGKGMDNTNLRFDVEAEEGHWHMTWRKGFRKAYPWLMGSAVMKNKGEEIEKEQQRDD